MLSCFSNLCCSAQTAGRIVWRIFTQSVKLILWSLKHSCTCMEHVAALKTHCAVNTVERLAAEESDISLKSWQRPNKIRLNIRLPFSSCPQSELWVSDNAALQQQKPAYLQTSWAAVVLLRVIKPISKTKCLSFLSKIGLQKGCTNRFDLILLMKANVFN